MCFSLHKDTTPPQPNHNITPTHIEPEPYNTWNKSTISCKLLKMDVLTFATCWAVNSEIIKQVTSVGLSLSNYQDDARSNKHKITQKCNEVKRSFRPLEGKEQAGATASQFSFEDGIRILCGNNDIMTFYNFYNDIMTLCHYKKNQHCAFSWPFSKIVTFMRYVGKYCTAGQATGDNTARGHCILDT